MPTTEFGDRLQALGLKQTELQRVIRRLAKAEPPDPKTINGWCTGRVQPRPTAWALLTLLEEMDPDRLRQLAKPEGRD